MDIRVLLKQMVEREASDLYLTVDSPPGTIVSCPVGIGFRINKDNTIH